MASDNIYRSPTGQTRGSPDFHKVLFICSFPDQVLSRYAFLHLTGREGGVSVT